MGLNIFLDSCQIVLLESRNIQMGLNYAFRRYKGVVAW